MGIDPGVKNFGLAILKEDHKVLHSETLDVSKMSNIQLCAHLLNLVHTYEVNKCGIERFVAYKGRLVKSAESIYMMTGAIEYSLGSKGVEVILCRAIEWKSGICKYLFKHKGFKNISKNFDKKYSMNVAEFITGIVPPTDHEADSIGVAYFAGEVM